MEMHLSDQTSEQVRRIFEPAVESTLSDSEVFEASCNLLGFGRTLLKMQMEVDKNGAKQQLISN